MKLLFVVVGLVAALLVAEGKFVCPSSPVSQHAGCQIQITFKNTCDEVRQEISSRINGQYDQWHDPHNNGTYSFTNTSDDSQWDMQRLTGDGKYIDKLIYTFEDNSNGCDVGACSESQVFSIGDYGTNFCNLHDLYCSDEGCRPFTQLVYSEAVGKCTEAEPSVCLID